MLLGKCKPSILSFLPPLNSQGIALFFYPLVLTEGFHVIILP